VRLSKQRNAEMDGISRKKQGSVLVNWVNFPREKEKKKYVRMCENLGPCALRGVRRRRSKEGCVSGTYEQKSRN